MKPPAITQEILKLISEVDEFKGTWRALKTLAPERLAALKKVATIESIGSSTRIEGAKLSDKQVEELLSLIGKQSFSTQDEQETALFAKLPKLSVDILELAAQRGRITTKDIIEATGEKRSTIKNRLAELVERELLTRIGKGRGTWYSRVSQ